MSDYYHREQIFDHARAVLDRDGVFSVSKQRVVEGIATSDCLNANGWAVDTLGAAYRLPLPLLLQHEAARPIGWVDDIVETKHTIQFLARVACAGLPWIERVWDSIKWGQLGAVSVGVEFFESDQNPSTRQYKAWRLSEISLCPVGANPHARVLVVRERIDALFLKGDSERWTTHRDMRPLYAISEPARRTAA